jgi:hypothetical protein
MRNRVIIAFGVVLFLVLAGTGTASALWSSLSGVGGTVSAAKMGITQTGFEGLSADYNVNTTTAIQKLVPVTVTNTGTTTSKYSLVMRGTTPNAIATSTSVQSKPATSAANCVGMTVSTAYNWTNFPELKGELAPGASAVHCVQTTITAAAVKANAGISMTATLTLTASVGTWKVTDDGTATQASRDTDAPSAPAVTVSGTTATSTTLTWKASTDNVGVVGYDLYRNSVMVASGVGNTWTDNSLVRNMSYTYKLDARDAAGNIASTEVIVKTLRFDPSIWYTVRASQATGQCVDASGNGTSNYTSLILWGCTGGDNEAWKFVPLANDTFRISARHAPSAGWAIPTYGNGSATLWTYDNATTSQWRILDVGTSGTMLQFVNVATGKCLDLTGDKTLNNTALVQANCVTLTAKDSQAFTIAVDN